MLERWREPNEPPGVAPARGVLVVAEEAFCEREEELSSRFLKSWLFMVGLEGTGWGDGRQAES